MTRQLLWVGCQRMIRVGVHRRMLWMMVSGGVDGGIRRILKVHTKPSFFLRHNGNKSEYERTREGFKLIPWKGNRRIHTPSVRRGITGRRTPTVEFLIHPSVATVSTRPPSTRSLLCLSTFFFPLSLHPSSIGFNGI